MTLGQAVIRLRDGGTINCVPLALFLASFTLYLKTLVPTLYWGDSGEFATTSYFLGIPHQPGYPLYNLLGKLFTYLPVGNVAFRMNIISALFAALTVMAVYLIVLKIILSLKPLIPITKSNFRLTLQSFDTPINHLPPLIAALVFATSYTFWEQSLQAEVYTLFLFFVVTLILILLRWQEEKNNYYLYFFVLILGLAMAHHLLIIPLTSAFLFFIIASNYKAFFNFKNILIMALLFFLSLSLYFYLPLRSATNPLINWGSPEVIKDFISTLTLSSPGGIEELSISTQWHQRYISLVVFIRILSYIILLLPLYLSFVLVSRKVSSSRKRIVSGIIFILTFILFIFAYFFLIRLIPWYRWTQGVHQFIYVEQMSNQFGALCLLIAVLGMVELYPFRNTFSNGAYRKKVSLFFLLWFLFFFSTAFVVLQIYPDNNPIAEGRFNLPAYLILSIFIGLGIRSIMKAIVYLSSSLKLKAVSTRDIVYLLFVLLLFIPLIPVSAHYREMNKSRYYFTEDYGSNILKSVKKDALILASGIDTVFPLWYLCYVEKRRGDVQIIYVEGLSSNWYSKGVKQRGRIILSSRGIAKKSGNEKTNKFLENIILDNKKYPIYWTGTRFIPESIEKRRLIPRGIVFRVSKDLKRIITLDDIKRDTHYLYKVYKYRGISDKSTSQDRKAKGAINLYANAHYQLGTLYLGKNKIDKAVGEFKQTLALNPEHSSAYKDLGLISYFGGQTSKAISYYKKALDYDPNNVYLRNELGEFYLQNNQVDKAELEFKRCIKIYPEYTQAYYNLGITYLWQDKLYLAKSRLLKATLLEPKFFPAHFSLGQVYLQLNEKENALKEFKTALKLDPQNLMVKDYIRELEEK